MKRLFAVHDIRYNRTLLRTESEARAGMLRYAATLGAGTDARASAEDFARNGDLTAFPPVRPAWLYEGTS